jgi:hypothetical protein
MQAYMKQKQKKTNELFVTLHCFPVRIYTTALQQIPKSTATFSKLGVDPLSAGQWWKQFVQWCVYVLPDLISYSNELSIEESQQKEFESCEIRRSGVVEAHSKVWGHQRNLAGKYLY